MNEDTKKYFEELAQNYIELTLDMNTYERIIKDIEMTADINVQRESLKNTVRIKSDVCINKAKWLDNGESLSVNGNSFVATTFNYGTSHNVRVAEFTLKK